MKIEKFFGKR